MDFQRGVSAKELKIPGGVTVDSTGNPGGQLQKIDILNGGYNFFLEMPKLRKIRSYKFLHDRKILMNARASSKKNDSFYHINICHNKFRSHISLCSSCYCYPFANFKIKDFYCRHEPNHETFYIIFISFCHKLTSEFDSFCL